MSNVIVVADQYKAAVAHVLGIIANDGTIDEITIALREELKAAYEDGLAAVSADMYARGDAIAGVEQRAKTKASVFAALYIAIAREAYMPDEIDAATYTKTMVDTLIANGALAEADSLLTKAMS